MFDDSNIVSIDRQTDNVLPGTSPEDRRKLLAAGFEPLPILAAEKKPYIKGWTQGPITEGRLGLWESKHPDHTSTGIRTGRVVAIDVDLTDPEHAAAVEMAVESELGPTLFRRVGSKGAIILYRIEGEPLAKITLKGTPPHTNKSQKIEILGRGQQFVAYGLHPSTGSPYQWTESDPLSASLADLPAVTPERLRKAAKLALHTLEGLGYSDLTDPETLTGERKSRKESPATGKPVSLENMRDWLSYVDPTDRDVWVNMSFAVASANIVSNGEGIEWADRAELFDAWSCGDLNPAHHPHNYAGRDDCDQMLEYGEPGKPNGITVASLIMRATLAGWSGSPYESLFDDFDRAGEAEENPTGAEPVEKSVFKLPKFYDIRGFMSRGKREDHIIKGWLPSHGFVALNAARGTGKSTIMLDMALRVAYGMEWHEQKIRDGFFPLYLCGEDDEGLELNMRAWHQHNNPDCDLSDLPADAGYFADTVPPLNKPADIVAWAEEIVRLANGRRCITFLDTWQRATAGAGQNKDEDMQTAIRCAEMLVAGLNGPLVAACHPPKDGRVTILGSSVIENSTTGIWYAKGWGPDSSRPLGYDLAPIRVKNGRTGSDRRFLFNYIALGETDYFGEEREGVVPSLLTTGGLSDYQLVVNAIITQPGMSQSEVARAVADQEIELRVATRDLTDEGTIEGERRKVFDRIRNYMKSKKGADALSGYRADDGTYSDLADRED